MTSQTDHAESVRGLRQLRRIRVFYAGGAVLWAVSAASAWWEEPGSRPMWVSVLFLVVFLGLLSLTSLWLSQRQGARTGTPVHRAAPRGMAWRHHADA
ncbi:hypothetical protein ACFYNL_34985 [Streptomyces sp. NPDC007808]|uniref:hypothetical protein n=1 Tax=Streptomyces sp. NPDC007808 TaxID=3364779 RepID=UPI0036CE32F3